MNQKSTPDPIGRRQFLQAGLALSGALLASPSLRAETVTTPSEALRSSAPPPSSTGAPHEQFDRYFLPILAGFLRNARETDPTYAVCDFPDGTMLKGCSTPSGKTYVSVARMLPAMAAWAVGGRDQASTERGETPATIREILLSIYRHAFDPAHPHYWGEANPRKADQRQVEASLVAHALWLLGDNFIRDLTPPERTNIQTWLASCTRVPEHKHNHAWFSAVNQAARLQLAPRWPEFSGDAAWMHEDLKALNGMAVPGNTGWYNDYPGFEVYDWYNSWTYASHFLLWREIVGETEPEWMSRYLPRLKAFLEKAPHFFAANGSHVLFGRSLIYRWAAVTGLVLAYQQGLWPHSPGLLRRIIRGNLEFFWNAGAFDEARGKLRETFAPDSSPGIRERYIDNGHPYWGMQAFAFYRLPKDDPFWTAPEEPLPVEKGSYQLLYPELGMTLLGTKESGQVRWLESRNLHKETYRDKYIKFAYSSHFPFNVLDSKDRIPWDQTLVFRDPRSGLMACRSAVRRGELLPDGTLLIDWSAVLGDCSFEITSRIRPFGEFEERTHTIAAPSSAISSGIEILEGSYSLGLADEQVEERAGTNWQWLRSPRNGYAVFSASLHGYNGLQTSRSFGEPAGAASPNVLSPKLALNTLRATIRDERTTLVSLHYASPKPLNVDDLLRTAFRTTT